MILCLTGPMAAGKNVAEEILKTKGFLTFDADVMVHDIVEQKKDEIVKEFLSEAQSLKINLLNADGTLNRRTLGQIVFLNETNTQRQEQIVYPELNRQFDQILKDNPQKDIAVNATVLFKIPLMQKVDSVLYIDAPKPLRFLRIKKRDARNTRDILNRFKSQKNLFAKYRLLNADTIRVWNIGTRHRLEKKIDEFLASRR